MSKDIEVSPLRTDDLTPEQLDRVAKFEESGRPGIQRADESSISLALRLYLDGNSYQYISNKTRISMDVILYFSKKYKWLEIKREHYTSLTAAINHKIEIEKVESLNFMAELTSSFRAYFQSRFDEFKRSKDGEVLENTDFKMLSHYFKALEAMGVMGKGGEDDKSPGTTFNLNLTGDATIKKVDNNTLEITNNNPQNKSVLEMLAEIKMKKEEKK